MSDLPKPDEPLNCAFQRRQDKKKILCAVTVRGAGSMMLSAANYDLCLIDICPLYQTMKMVKTLQK